MDTKQNLNREHADERHETQNRDSLHPPENVPDSRDIFRETTEATPGERGTDGECKKESHQVRDTKSDEAKNPADADKKILTKNKKKIKKHGNKLDELQTSVDSIQDTQAQHKQTLDEHGEKLDGLQTSVDSIQETQAQHQETLAKNKKKLKKHDKKLDKLQNSVDKHGEELKDIRSEIKGVRSRLNLLIWVGVALVIPMYLKLFDISIENFFQ